MKIYIRNALSVLLLTFASASAIAQNAVDPNQREGVFSKVGATMGNFLTMPVGARAMALGSGFVGIADDPTALFWNPAGITLQPGATAAYSYTAMIAGTGVNFAGATYPLSDMYKVGVSALTYSSGDIEITDLFNDKGTGATYSVRDLAFGVSLAGQLTEQFSFGVTGKL